MAAMKCPSCGNFDCGVVDSRSSGEAIRRRRFCGVCSERFTTYEFLGSEIDGVIFRTDGSVSGTASRWSSELARIYTKLSGEDAVMLMSMARHLAGRRHANEQGAD